MTTTDNELSIENIEKELAENEARREFLEKRKYQLSLLSDVNTYVVKFKTVLSEAKARLEIIQEEFNKLVGKVFPADGNSKDVLEPDTLFSILNCLHEFNGKMMGDIHKIGYQEEGSLETYLATNLSELRKIVYNRHRERDEREKNGKKQK